MLSEKNKALLVKLFFMSKESATVALLKFRLQKNVKTGKWPSTVVRLIKLLQRFEETGSLKDTLRSGRPTNPSELKDAIHRELSCIQADIMHSAVPGVVTRLECALPCGGGYVEHILL
ncbi:hypothetical protein TNCV_2481581 [Trichonephila clavipes]|nr:hypothetical protein TNCV_2481581 [Trichonephila clavipes]